MATLIDTYGGSGALGPTTQGFSNIQASSLQINPKLLEVPKLPEVGIKSDKAISGTWANEKPKLDNLTKTEETPKEAKAEETEVERLERLEREQLAHQEEREDTAYQRAIADMRKAGWNTDGLSPVGSASAATLDSSRSTAEKDRELELKKLYEELKVAVSEGNKNRTNAIITSIIKLGGSVASALIFKK